MKVPLQVLWEQARQGTLTASMERRLASDPRAGAKALCQFMARQHERQRQLQQHGRRMLQHERRLWPKHGLLAGIDEVGMGPLAGPVVAAAVIFAPDKPIPAALDDSKRLTAKVRTELYGQICRVALACGVGWVTPSEIDTDTIYQAGLLAMERALQQLACQPGALLIDARRLPRCPLPQYPLIGGDGQSASIAAASIVAKCCRDAWMVEQDRHYPAYGFAQHKGYPTPSHLAALARFGPSPLHRRHFRPVAQLLAVGQTGGELAAQSG